MGRKGEGKVEGAGAVVQRSARWSVKGKERKQDRQGRKVGVRTEEGAYLTAEVISTRIATERKGDSYGPVSELYKAYCTGKSVRLILRIFEMNKIKWSWQTRSDRPLVTDPWVVAPWVLSHGV